MAFLNDFIKNFALCAGAYLIIELIFEQSFMGINWLKLVGVATVVAIIVTLIMRTKKGKTE